MGARYCFRLRVQGLTRSAHPKDDFIAVRTELGVLHAPGLKKNQAVHRLPLRVQKLVARKRAGTSTGDNLGAFSFGQAGEQGGSAHQHEVLSNIGLDRRRTPSNGTSVHGPGYFGRHIIAPR